MTHLTHLALYFCLSAVLFHPVLRKLTFVYCDATEYVSRKCVSISQRQSAAKPSVYHCHCLTPCLLLRLFLLGWFCVSAAWNSQPFDLDNYTNANCLCPATSTGGRCQVGFYCPVGSSEPLPCPPGTFCNISGIWTHHEDKRTLYATQRKS